jgi:spore maturation protein CgeB
MEALISGACVFSDFMYGLPAGLQNGTSIVMFTSAEDLKNQILYYLAHDEERMAIGREGRYIAMTRHRTWHRIEEIIFDQVMSTCEAAAVKNSSTACPWVVHANEMRRRRRRLR